MTPAWDLVVVGSGFAGSILAMIARRLGHRVLLLERGRHPRFAIGESSSPLTGILLEQLAERYDLPALASLASYGAWQRAHPEVVCGLKRGFTFFSHQPGRRFGARADRGDQLLVAASPNDELADTHWLRSDVDAWLVQHAVSMGVEYLDETRVEDLQPRADGVRLTVGRDGRRTPVDTRGLVDATGPRGCVHKALELPESTFVGYPGTQALFTHFTDVERCDGLVDYRPSLASGGVSQPPPYPMDDAAVHHVFDGGWMWVLRFANGVTSAGVAVTDALAADLRLADGEAAWLRLLARFPSLAAQFSRAQPIRPWQWQPRLAYRASRIVGDRWAMLPSAAAFVDPIFSTGFPLTLLGVETLARLLEEGLFAGSADASASGALAAYGAATLAEADHTARFVGGCYAAFPRFEVFASYSMFYFAVASFEEARRRLRPADRGFGFLAVRDARLAAEMARLAPSTAGPVVEGFAEHVARAIEPVNVAGLCRPDNTNWYGVNDEDLVAGAAKLGVSAEAVQRMLTSLGLSIPTRVLRAEPSGTVP